MDMAHTHLALQTHWSRLRPLIQKAVPFIGGTHNEEDLIKAVMAGEITFWPGQNAFALAAVERFPRQVRLNLILAGGDPDEVVRIEPSIIAWGRALGASVMRTDVRPALDRIAEHGADIRGFKRQRIVYVREI